MVFLICWSTLFVYWILPSSYLPWIVSVVMINKGCRVSQTMPGFLSFVDLDVQQNFAILELVSKISKAVDNSEYTMGLFPDLSKAYLTQ